MTQRKMGFLDDPIKFDTNETKVCKECGGEFPLGFFYKNNTTSKKTGEQYYHPRCKVCHNNRQIKRYHAMSRVPYPEDSKCDCCGKETDKLNFDECHETDTHRGWICSPCNLGIGRLGDNEEGILKALEYIRRHNASI